MVRAVDKGPKEAVIERKSSEHARGQGWITYKFESPGHVGVPDRMNINPHGFIIFIEFKRKGGKTTPSQDREIARLKSRGLPVYVIDSIEEAIKIYAQFQHTRPSP